MIDRTPYQIKITCRVCNGTKLIPGSRNWNVQGWVEAYCWHCDAGYQTITVQLDDEGIEQEFIEDSSKL